MVRDLAVSFYRQMQESVKECIVMTLKWRPRGAHCNVQTAQSHCVPRWTLCCLAGGH